MTTVVRWLTGAAVSVLCLSVWNDMEDCVAAARWTRGVAAAVSVLRGIPDEQRLLAKIQRNYDSRVRPVYNSSHRVTVKFALTLTQIIDVVGSYVYTTRPLGLALSMASYNIMSTTYVRVKQRYGVCLFVPRVVVIVENSST